MLLLGLVLVFLENIPTQITLSNYILITLFSTHILDMDNATCKEAVKEGWEPMSGMRGCHP